MVVVSIKTKKRIKFILIGAIILNLFKEKNCKQKHMNNKV